ncbi:hypothetical protein CJJ07_003035 [Candidozyma auris]|nr:hypothetical protein CJJ07_003035 [[Candida] auris]QEL60474.1 hypothetical protein CJJ09_002582 [[Candida] auris]
MTATSMQMHRPPASLAARDSGHLAPPRESVSRRRSNSQSQVIPHTVSVQARTHRRNGNGGANGRPSHTRTKSGYSLPERHQSEFYVTLVPLNDTFVRKHIHVPYFPDVCKLGRPTGTKVKPSVSNGYFDSRVLSRNHASLFIEPKSGQLMIQDMGSSNGTYVNQEKISSEPVPINIGDRINLGFNIQVETSHKQISAMVEDISIVSNTPSAPMLSGLPKLTPEIVSKFTGAEKRHLDYLQGLFEQISGKEQEVEEDEANDPYGGVLTTSKSFESGMFSDVTPSMEEVFSATTAEPVTNGIFVNSRLVRSNDLESTLTTLVSNLAKVKQQNNTLKSLQTFLSNYSKKVNEINDEYVKGEVKKHELRFVSELDMQSTKFESRIAEQVRQLEERENSIRFLESQVEKLKHEHTELQKELELQRLPSTNSRQGVEPQEDDQARSEYSETPGAPRRISVDISSFDFGTGKLVKEGSTDGSEDVDEISNSSDLGSEDSGAHKHIQSNKLASPEGTIVKNPSMNEAFEQVNQLRTKGVAVGLVIILAGFVYQTCHK